MQTQFEYIVTRYNYLLFLLQLTMLQIIYAYVLSHRKALLILRRLPACNKKRVIQHYSIDDQTTEHLPHEVITIHIALSMHSTRNVRSLSVEQKKCYCVNTVAFYKKVIFLFTFSYFFTFFRH